MDKNELFETHQHLVERTLYSLYKTKQFINHIATINGMSEDDLFAIGNYGLWKACLNYEQYKDRFRSYAINCIKGYISTELRRNSTLLKFNWDDKLEDKLSVKLIDYDGYVPNTNKLKTSDTISNGDYLESEALSNVIYEYVTHDLSSRDKMIFRKRLKEYKFSEIAKDLGVTPQSVSNYYKKALEKVKKNYELMGEVV